MDQRKIPRREADDYLKGLEDALTQIIWWRKAYQNGNGMDLHAQAVCSVELSVKRFIEIKRLELAEKK